MRIKKPKSVLKFELEIASKTDVLEVTAHPSETGPRELWMFFLQLTERVELVFYLTGKDAEEPAIREDIISWISSQESTK